MTQKKRNTITDTKVILAYAAVAANFTRKQRHFTAYPQATSYVSKTKASKIQNK